MQQTTLTNKGQVTIPKDIRDFLYLHAGDKIEFTITKKNEVLLRPMTKKIDDVFGSLCQSGRAVISIEQMNLAIKQKVREKFK